MLDDDFTAYCRLLTDAQLEEVLRKEHEARRDDDYQAAVLAAADRGWRVYNGKRLWCTRSEAQ